MGFAQRRISSGQSEHNRDFMAVEQDIWFAWHISRGAILKLFEPVEGKGSLDGFFLYSDLNSGLYTLFGGIFCPYPPQRLGRRRGLRARRAWRRRRWQTCKPPRKEIVRDKHGLNGGAC